MALFKKICINTSKGQNPVLLLLATLAQKDMHYLALKEPVEAAREEDLSKVNFCSEPKAHTSRFYISLSLASNAYCFNNSEKSGVWAPLTLLGHKRLS